MQTTKRKSYELRIPDETKGEDNTFLAILVPDMDGNFQSSTLLDFLEVQQMIRDLTQAVFSIKKMKPACE